MGEDQSSETSNLIDYLDPGMVMALSASIDKLLGEILKSKMRPLNSKLNQRIFRGYGPLNSFSARIDVAFAFKLIPENVYMDLIVIKAIRNEFAHADELMTFKNPAIVKECSKFGENGQQSLSDLFMNRCKIILSALRERVHPP